MKILTILLFILSLFGCGESPTKNLNNKSVTDTFSAKSDSESYSGVTKYLESKLDSNLGKNDSSCFDTTYADTVTKKQISKTTVRIYTRFHDFLDDFPYNSFRQVHWDYYTGRLSYTEELPSFYNNITYQLSEDSLSSVEYRIDYFGTKKDEIHKIFKGKKLINK